MLELTLVVLMIAVLMGVAVVSMPGILGRTKQRATIASMGTIKTAINAYHGFYSQYPPSLPALQTGKNPFLDETMRLEDGWKQPFLYSTPGMNGRPYDLVSKGADGKFPSDDDVNVWTPAQE